VSGDDSALANLVRQEFTAHLADEGEPREVTRSAHDRLHHDALNAARQAVLGMRNNREIGDDAFHQLEEELDWLEMAGRRTEEDGSS
jgi:monovalent cation/hydrogen antiporter